MKSARTYLLRSVTLGFLLGLLLAFAPQIHAAESAPDAAPGTVDVAEAGTDAFSLPLTMPRLTVNAQDMQRANSFFLKPLLAWMADPSATMSVEKALAAAHAGLFKGMDSLPLTEAAVVWLCLPVELVGGTSSLISLDLGQGLPGRVSVFAPSGNGSFTEWENIRRSGTLTLPVVGEGVLPVFIRMEGAPGPWFMPRLLPVAGSEPSGLQTWNLLLAGIFGAVWLFGLLTSRRNSALWRPWCSLIAVMCLIHMVYGQAITPNGYVPFSGLPGLLSLGVAMLLLPHVGRSLMDTANLAPGLDKVLRACCLLLALLTLLPLVPGLAWLTRFAPVWPAVAVLLLPLAIAGGVKGLPHAPRLFIGCLLTLAAVLPDIILLASGKAPLGTPQSGLWGLALALILYSSATPLAQAARPEQEKGVAKGTKVTTPLMPKSFLDTPESQAVPPAWAEGLTGQEAQQASFAQESGEQNEQGEWSGQGDTPEQAQVEPDAPAQPAAGFRTEDRLTPAEVEQALHLPLVTLLDALEPFENDDIPEELRQQAEAVRQAGFALSHAAGDPSTALAVSQSVPEPEAVFTLADLFARVHGATREDAEKANISVTYNLPEELEQSFTGDLVRLDTTLRMLLHSAIQGTDEGVIHVSVRQQPEDPAPGHLLFTVRDTGTRMAPQERSLSALYRAWALASASKGAISFESSPAQGTLAAFSVQLTPTSPSAAAFVHSDPATAALARAHAARRQRLMQAIVADDVATSRQQIAQSLNILPQPPLEARNPMEALHLYRRVPVGLVVMDGDMLEADILEAIAGIRTHERENRMSPVPLVVLVNHQLQGRLFVDAGATEMLIKPVSRETLVNTVRRLTSMLEDDEATAAAALKYAAQRSAAAIAAAEAPQPVEEAAPAPEGETPVADGTETAAAAETATPPEAEVHSAPATEISVETPDSPVADTTLDMTTASAAESAPAQTDAAQPDSFGATDATQSSMGAPSVVPPEAPQRAPLPRLNIPADRRPVSRKAQEETAQAGPAQEAHSPEEIAQAGPVAEAPLAAPLPAPLAAPLAETLAPAAPAPAAPAKTRGSKRRNAPPPPVETLMEEAAEAAVVQDVAPVETLTAQQSPAPEEVAPPSAIPPLTAPLESAPTPENHEIPADIPSGIPAAAPAFAPAAAASELSGAEAGFTPPSILETDNLFNMVDDPGLSGLLGEDFMPQPAPQPKQQSRARQNAGQGGGQNGEPKPRQKARVMVTSRQTSESATGPEEDGQPDSEPQPARPNPAQFLNQARGWLKRAQSAREAGHLDDVEQAANNIALSAEQEGLRVLERMARCVERAAAARDPLAVSDLMPDLIQAVERADIQAQNKQ